MNEDAKYLKKNIKSVELDVHPTEKALIVKYQLEASILGQLGDPMVGDRKECQKIIRLKDMKETTEVGLLAKEVIDRCKLIPASRLAELEQLIYYLKNRRETKGSAGSDRSGSIRSNSSSLSNNDRPNTDFGELGTSVKERASLSNLEEYIEMLYEDVQEKTQGTAFVLQLAKNPEYLEELLQNETLLGALARVLKEDWKKSFDLATNIVYIFFCFSSYSQFQSVISHFKVGTLCMQVIESELTRYDRWKQDLTNNAASGDRNSETSRKKFQILVKKQDQLLRVCIYLLLNLAEDIKTEVKMVNRGLVPMLGRCLAERSNDDLIILTLTFLKKLSVFSESKDQMLKIKIVDKVAGLFPSNNDELISVSLQLLFNLSFDLNHRLNIVSVGLLDHIVPLLKQPNQRKTAAQLLYQLSVDDDTKAMFANTDCIALSIEILLKEESNKEDEGTNLLVHGGNSSINMTELIKALLINLAVDRKNGQEIVEGQRLRLLFQRAFTARDVLILKIIRNVAAHDGPTKALFLDYIGNLAETVCRQSEQPGREFEFCVECMGILAVLDIPDLDWGRLLTETGLLQWMQAKMDADGKGIEDDLLLETVILCGTVAADASGALILLQNSIVDRLVGLLSAKQEDDEIVLQIVYIFYRMMFHDGLRERLLSETQVPAYLIDLMHDKNAQVRNMCDSTLQVIAEHGDEWAKKIQEEKFRWHNAQWLEMIGHLEGKLQLSSTLIDMTNAPSLNLDASDSDDDNSNLFNEMYGLQAEDILDNYESSDERPESRLDYQSHQAGDAFIHSDDELMQQSKI